MFFPTLRLAVAWVVFVFVVTLRGQPPPTTSSSGTVELGQSVPISFRPPGLPPDTTYRWFKDGTLIAGATTNTYTIAAATATDAGTYLIALTIDGTVSSSAFILTVKPAAAPIITTAPRATTAVVGQSVAFSFVATGSFPRTYQWRKDGNDLIGSTAANLSFTGLTTAHAGAYSVVVTNSLGSTASASAALTVNAATPPALFSGNPGDVITTLGSPAFFNSALVGGSNPLTFQWLKNGAPIPGATGSGFSLFAVAYADAGKYSYTVTNVAGTATSREATLTVNAPAPVTILTPPQNQTVFQGQSFSLSVSASGSPPFTYQWMKNDVPLTGFTFGNYGSLSAATADAGSYSVVVTNPAGSVTSQAATVVVNPAIQPAIVTPPADQKLGYLEDLRLNVQVSGSPPFTYTWNRNGVPLSGSGGSSSANSQDYTFFKATDAQSGAYTVTVTNAAGTVTSRTATVTVASALAPQIDAQPVDVQIPLGLPTGFSVRWTGGTGPLTFQWLKNGLPIPDATAPSCSIAAVRLEDAGAYSLVLSGVAGTVTSAAARLTVLPPTPPPVSGWPFGRIALPGWNIGFSAGDLRGGTPITYQWSKDGVPIVGATNFALNFSPARLTDLATYMVTITNDGGVATSPGMRLRLPYSATSDSGPNTTPWLDVGRVGDVLYFLATAPARIERYDLAAERWLLTTLFSPTQIPTAFAPAPEGVYLAYGRALVRRSLDLATETPIINVPTAITFMFPSGNHLYFYPGGPSAAGLGVGVGMVHRTTLQAGAGTRIGFWVNSLSHVSLAPGRRQGFLRYLGSDSSRAAIEAFVFAEDGTVSGTTYTSSDGSMPSASRAYVFPDERFVADDSGIVYRTSDLTYAGSLGESFADLAFFADGTPVLLRGAQLVTTRADNFLEIARAPVAIAAHRVFCRGSHAFVFGPASSGSQPYSVAKVTAAEFAPAPPPAPVTTGRYSIDDAMVGADNIVHLLSRTRLALLRWDPASRRFLSPVPLRSTPRLVSHQPGNPRALIYYPDGAVTEVTLGASSTAERMLFYFGPDVSDLVDLGDSVLIRFGSNGATRVIYAAGGPRLVTPDNPQMTRLAWQAATRRLYGISSLHQTLQYVGLNLDGTTIQPPGTFTSAMPGESPLWLNAEGSLLLSKNRLVLNADLLKVGTLANDFSDAAWLGDALYTVRTRASGIELQQWARATYLPIGVLNLPGIPVRLLRLADSRLLVVASVQGILSLTIVNADLTVVPPPPVTDLAGVYIGKLGATGTAGDFALQVGGDGSGVFLAHLATTRAGFVATGFTLGADGNFVANGRDLATGASRFVTGTVSTQGVVGSIPSNSLPLSGSKTGTGSFAAGFFPAPALNGSAGTAYAISGADGRTLMVAASSATATGGVATLDPSGNLSLTTASGAKITAKLAPAGALSATIDSGGFTSTTFAGLRDDLPRTDRLANISTRGRAGAGEDVMIAGFVLSGTASRPVLIRAIGPALGAFGVPSTLADPRLSLYRGETKLSENDNWSTAANASELATTTARVGGFPLASGSADAALLVNLDPGAYTAQVSTATASPSGQSLVEVYDAGSTSASAEPRLINIATRGRIASAGDTLIAGIVVTGNAPKRLLIRAIGPGLAAFGVPGTLADPVLTITGLTATGTLATNDDWSTPAANGATASELAAAAVSVGAFALPANSRDACLLLTLAPGNYTAQVTGKNNSTGIALVEVYEVNN